jgi:hypothetical protein
MLGNMVNVVNAILALACRYDKPTMAQFPATLLFSFADSKP